MKAWMIVAAVLVAALAGYAVYVWATAATPVRAAKVQRSVIREFVDERGKTRLPRIYSITMPYSGRIEEIALEAGSPVAAGQTLAQISTVDIDNEIAQALAVVQQLEASIAENDDISVESGAMQQAERFVDSMVSTVAAAEARMTSGKKRLEYNESFLATVRQLLSSGAKTQDDVDRADVDYVESQVDYQQDVLVWEAMKSIHAATALMPQMVRDYIARKYLSRAVLLKELAEAAAQLRQVQTRQQRGTIISQVDGVVLELSDRNEQFLAAGTLLMRIGQLEQLEVEADLLSQDVMRFQRGAGVEIYGPTISAAAGDPTGDAADGGVQGYVHRIDYAGFTKISSLGVEQQRVKVIIRFADGVLQPIRDRHELGVDYRVRVRIFSRQKEAALVVPRSALFRGPDGRSQVFAVRNGRARLQNVQIGLANDQQVEITEGLQENDLVVLAPEHSLADGHRVKPAVVR